MRRSSLALALALTVVPVACFELDRTQGTVPGDIAGRGLRVDLAEGAAFVKVQTVGSSLRRSGDDDGSFRLSGLPPGRFDLRLVDDKDGDGWTDRGAIASGVLPSLPDGRPGFLLLGDVKLEGSFGLRGSALQPAPVAADPPVPVDDDFVVRVYALRGSCLPISDDVVADTTGAPCSAEDVTNRVELGNDGETAADSVGAWQLTRLQAGTVDLVALLHERGPSGELGAVVDVEGPITFVGVADGNETPRDDGPTFVFDGVPIDPARIELVFSTAVVAGAFAVFAPPGSAVAGCDDAKDTPAPAIVADLEAGATSAQVGGLPPGPYEVVVCSGPLRGALTNGPVALPTDDDDIPARWPVLLLEVDPCPEGVDDRDCDGDGLRSMPLSRLAELNVACAASCFPAGDLAGSLGEGLGNRTCQIDGDTFDCDDDSDGQPDVTEALLCIGIGRGTDLDGDGLCSNSDPFPQCAANNAIDCVAGDEDLSPSLVGGGSVDGGDFGIVTPGPTLPGGLLGTAVRAEVDGRTFAVMLGLVNEAGEPDDDIFGIELDGASGGALVPLGNFVTAGLAGGSRVRFATAPAGDGQALLLGGLRGQGAETVVFGDMKVISLTAVDATVSTVFADIGDGPIFLSTPRVDASAIDLFGVIAVVGGRGVDGGNEFLLGDIEVHALGSPDGPSIVDLAEPRALAVVESLFDAVNFTTHVVVMGGETADGPTRSVETFGSESGSPTLTPDAVPVVPQLNEPHARHTFHQLQPSSSEIVFVVVGGDGGAGTWEVWRQGEERWTSNALLVPRTRHASVVLPDGRILVVGGNDPVTNAPLSSTEVLDPTTGSSVLATSLAVARTSPSAVTVIDGQIVIAGGLDADGKPLDSTEIFDVRRQIASPHDTLAPPDVTGCRQGAISDDGLTAALRCDVPPDFLGVVDADPETSELLFVDVSLGAVVCATCANGVALGALYDDVAIDPAGRIFFVSAGSFTGDFGVVDDNDLPDLYVAERFGPSITHTLLSTVQIGQDPPTAGGVIASVQPAFIPDVNQARAVFVMNGADGLPQLHMTSFSSPVVVDLSASGINPATIEGRLGAAAGTESDVRIVLRADGKGVRGLTILANPFFTGESFVDFIQNSEGPGDMFLSPDGQTIAWFSTTPLGDADDATSTDIFVSTFIDGAPTAPINATDDLDGSLCDLTPGAANACRPLSLTVDKRAAFTDLRAVEGPRALLIDLLGARGEVDLAGRPGADFVSVSSSGSFSTFGSESGAFLEPAIGDAQRVWRVDVAALGVEPGEGEGEGEGEIPASCLQLVTLIPHVPDTEFLQDVASFEGDTAIFANAQPGFAYADANDSFTKFNQSMFNLDGDIYASVSSNGGAFLLGESFFGAPIRLVTGPLPDGTVVERRASDHTEFVLASGNEGATPGPVALSSARAMIALNNDEGFLVWDSGLFATQGFLPSGSFNADPRFLHADSAGNVWALTFSSTLRHISFDGTAGPVGQPTMLPGTLTDAQGTQVATSLAGEVLVGSVGGGLVLTSSSSFPNVQGVPTPPAPCAGCSNTDAIGGVIFLDETTLLIGRVPRDGQVRLEIVDIDGTGLPTGLRSVRDHLLLTQAVPERLAIVTNSAGRIFVATASSEPEGAAIVDVTDCLPVR